MSRSFREIMKSLRVKVELVLFLVLMLVVMLSYGIQRFIILPGLNPYDEAAAQADITRAREALEREESRVAGELGRLLRQGVTQSAALQAQGDLQEEIERRDLDFIYLADAPGAGKGSLVELPAAAGLFDDIETSFGRLKVVGGAEAVGGAMMTNRGPALIAAQAHGTGMAVAGRLLDEAYLSQLQRQTTWFQLEPLTSTTSLDPRELRAVGELRAGQPYYVRRVDDEAFLVYALVNDVHGNPLLLMRSQTYVNVSGRAYETLQSGLLATVGIGLAALGLLVALFRVTVMNPLSRLTEHTMSIHETNDLSARLGMRRKDEIGTLAGEFDRMVAQLEADSDAQRLAEEALRASEERYALAEKGANDGLWDWDLKTETMYLSHRWKSMLGYEEHELENKPETWFKLIHPDEAEHVRAALDAHLAGQTAHLETEHRMVHRDGGHVWVLCRGLAVLDTGGVPSRMAGSQTDITPRKLVEEQLSHQALHDSLTNLPNRALFIDRLGQAMKQVKRNKEFNFAVLFLDLDRFKVVNDGLGHVVGDMLLTAVAEKISHSLRDSDTLARQSGTVARFGGDEFVLLIDNLRDVNDAILVAERLQTAIQEPVIIEGHEIFTSVSIGIAFSATGYHTQEELLRSADTAMYRAKALGKARYAVFDTDMHDKAMARLQLENDLRRAIDREEFVVHYQPVVSLSAGSIEGFEALVRWNHPERGLVSPMEFIPVAEETGMVLPIGEFVFRTASAQFYQWMQENDSLRHAHISVNLSVKDFTRHNLVEYVEEVLRSTGLPPENLKLEITESAIMESVDAATKALRRLRALNIGLSIDDFGTGYSSLSYLHRFPMSTLKIDRAFVRDMLNSPESLQIVKTVVLLAHALDLTVVAEGVETDMQVAILKDLHCEYGQGYFHSRAIPAEEVEGLLDRFSRGEIHAG